MNLNLLKSQWLNNSFAFVAAVDCRIAPVSG